MKKVNQYLTLAGFAALFLLTTIATRAETFAIQIGDTVSDGVPGPGAGRIAVRTATDVYTFSATANQLVFFEFISVDSAFAGHLFWELKSPTGQRVFGSYFDGTHPGRQTLPETGTYTITFSVTGTSASYIGTYAFRLQPIPPDTTFAIHIDDIVADGVPATGAGRIEVAGAQDMYTFPGTAGQLVFPEEISVDNTFAGHLFWELRSPAGTRVFGAYFDGSNPGRQTLPETGTYTLIFTVTVDNPKLFGAYSFRLRPIPPDATYAIQIGDTVADGIPLAGAGRIEVPGSHDLYTFPGTAGQLVFPEEISVDKAFAGHLFWELKSPSGTRVFSSYFEGTNPGRQTLPETGTYTLIFTVTVDNPNFIGTYSFCLRPNTQDTLFSIQIGDKVADGVPAAGAGRIEIPAARDLYHFQGTAGQNVVFEQISVDNAFTGHLFWELTSPTSQKVFGEYFTGNRSEPRALPESGLYTLTVYAVGTSVSYIGAYSFRMYSAVEARPDSLTTQIDHELAIPIGKFLCNDSGEPNDVLDVDLPSAATAQGGTVLKTTTAVLYVPKAGFSGTDSFVYILHGQFGGTNTARATVQVIADALKGPMVVSVFRLTSQSARACLLGTSNQTYQVDESTDLLTWLPKGTLTAAADGSATYDYAIDPTDTRFYRFRKP
jgi:hypothetical protein